MLWQVKQRFDSKLVRLKVKANGYNYYFHKFRFQTGSIKSNNQKQKISLALQFRFQTGSIKSRGNLRQILCREMFRFQTGSIKSDERYAELEASVMFRFQTGSIKSSGIRGNNRRFKVRFDSKLVRLKG